MGKQQSNPLPDRTSDEALAHELANYFSTKIETIRNGLQHVPRYIPSGLCNTELGDFISLSENQVRNLVLNAKSSTCEMDPIPSVLVKKHIDVLLPVVTRLVNESLVQGHFHDHWKVAVILPLLKKFSPQLSPSLYRPVSTLSFISKITEKGCIQQLNDYLSNNDLHSYHQSAYKEHCSIETTLCLLMDKLLWNMERTQVSVVVALDLSAAFDTVDHGVLDKVLMTNYGIKNTALEWLKSYLRDRQMCVKIDKSKSDLRTFNYSVPQGSCLGPLLFNMYASTIKECINPCQFISGYADDHIIMDSFSTSQSSQEQSCIVRLQETLLKVKGWMESNVLKMNSDKTEVAFFGSRPNVSITTTSAIDIAGDTVAVSDKLKYLGVWLDKNLSLEDHIQFKIKTAASSIRNIIAIRDYINTETAKLLATSLVLSHLDFANCVLIGLPDKCIKRLQRIQNWAAKAVLRRSKFDSSSDALQTLHWLPIRERIDFKVLCLVHKCLHDSAPKYLSDLLKVRKSSRHTRSGSAHLMLEVPFTRKATFADRSFSVAGPRMWNTLPPNIRLIDNFDAFKKSLKTHFFRRAFNNLH